MIFVIEGVCYQIGKRVCFVGDCVKDCGGTLFGQSEDFMSVGE
jgi:hypothetical protein